MSTLLVLAAGMGSRYGGLKQLDQMGPGGETVLDYSVYDAIRACFDHVVFVIQRGFSDAFREGVGSRFEDRIRVDYAYQELTDLPEGFSCPVGRKKPWGTTHAIRAARHLVEGNFAVINADDFYGRDAYEQAACRLNEMDRDEGGLVAYPLRNTLSKNGSVNRGVCEVSSEDYLVSVEEHTGIETKGGKLCGINMEGRRVELNGEQLVSMNLWLFPEGFFELLEGEFVRFLQQRMNEEGAESYIPTVVDALIREGTLRFRVVQTSATWFGVTYPDDKAFVESSIARLLDAGEYPRELIE